MKWRLNILILLMAACTRLNNDSVEPHYSTAPQTMASPELSAIDSLMWQRPDSALACLLSYFDTCCTDAKFCVSTMAYNHHYAHLLLAELLYKNDYAQTNRTELRQAVAYFDSLCYCRDGACAVSTTAFLDARAHYINGVGYYENDSVVEACMEYLKALETMETHFPFVETQNFASLPIPHIPHFMAYTYNRLGDLFSRQFMMESSIECYENSLVFTKIEPTSPQGVSILLSHIGNQYDKMEEMDKARQYYEQALKEMPDTNNLGYRDLITSIALCDHQLGSGMDQPLHILKELIRQTDDESEKLTRFLTIGDIFFENGIYDSALRYLEPVFSYAEDKMSQIQAAEYLQIIYDSIGDSEKADECMKFLAQHKKSEGKNKALVSQLNDLFQNYMQKKQVRLAEKERQKAIGKSVGIIISVAVALAFVIVFWVKHRGRKQMEAERQVHRMEQAALSGRLKRSNQEVQHLKGQIRQRDDETAKTEPVASFSEEPVCRLIMERVNEGQFKSKVDYANYKDSALDKQQLLALRVAADRHFGQFTVRLKRAYPKLTHADLDYCCLYLLGLSDADVAALMQRAYNTVVERNGKIRKILGNEDPLPVTLMGMAKDSSFV